MTLTLPDLPTELVQQITQYARIGYGVVKDPTLPTLRLTCQNLYIKTLGLFPK
jgi:hypothetical protein